MELAFVQSELLEKYLDTEVISAAEVTALLKRRGVLDGTPVYLNEETMMPLPPLCDYGRYLATALLDETTLKDYGRAIGRTDNYLVGLQSDILSATESDLVAYRDERTRWQKKPIGWDAWSKESFVLDDFYGFLVDRKVLDQRPVRVAARGRNALAARLRSGMDIRAVTRLPGRTAGVEEAEAAFAAVRGAARWWPGRAACLEESLAAHFTAALTGRRVTWVIGARFAPQGAHAWIETEGHVIGQEETDRVWPYMPALKVERSH
ncbi:lasso peptide biosynthesis B2 protein [Streptomyces sp. NPDC048281]|uniref:lasso peptide biosynthesis B2 protein n=1 Tax=Streptomyces sp. NPDC048281 TaxID=3154715 RepID=UPI0034413937